VVASLVACGGAGTGPGAPRTDLIERSGASVLGAGFDELGSDAVLQVAMTYPAPSQQAAEAPISLTASDGTGLELVRYDARASVDGPLAFTEIHLTFKNPEPRTIEGRFAIALPASASISRLAMKNDDGWQEAEVVERNLARRAYEDFLHRRQDPALLEKEAGNEFRARIFPIPGNGTKEIIVSYSEEIAGAEVPYQLALSGLPSIQDGRVTVFGGRGGKVERAWRGSRPDGDVVVPLDSSVAALATDRIVVARVAPKLSSTPEKIDAISVLFDTSASRAPGFRAEVDRLGGVIAGLRRQHGESVRLRVAVFDQVVTEIFDGSIAAFGPQQLQRVLSRRPLGASDLGRALDWLGSGTPTARAVLVTDGIPTLGIVEPAGLRAKVAALRGKLRRIDAVAVGGIRDGSLLADVVRGNLESDGVVADGGLGPDRVAEKIGKTTVSGVKVAVPGATWSWPAQIDGAQPGDETLVYAVFAEARAKGAPVAIELSGKVTETVRVVPRAAEGPLVERAAVRAEIERLAQLRSRLPEADAAGRDKMAKTIVDRSVKYRVLSDFTALLVLESESDYERYGIDRKALAGILSVGADGRIAAPQRTRPLPPPPPPEVAPQQVAHDGRHLTRAPPRPASRPPAKEPMDDAFGGGKQDRSPATGGSPPPDAEPPKRVVVKEAEIETKPAEKDAKEDAQRVTTAREAPKPEPMEERKVSGADAPAAAPPPPPPPPPPGAAPPRVRPGPVPSRPMAERDGDGILDLQDRDPSGSEDDEKGPPPYSGRMATVMDLLARKQTEAGLLNAIRWQNESPGDVMALVALGEALEAGGRTELAARAYGSIIDLFPARADLRRYAGMRLERLGNAFAPMAADTYGKAADQRPDHLTGHRSHAYALLRAGRIEDAAKQLVRGLHQRYPRPLSAGDQILREDLAIVAAAWMRREPARKQDVLAMLQQEGVMVATEPSLRFILQWETDANDVDFHIRDGKKGHAFFSQRELPSGGRLYEDVTSGYGPECFAIEGKPAAYPYRVSIHYYSRGPMGFGMGRLAILRHDGNGNLGFEERPFVVMNDGAYVQLGTIGPETAKIAP
jgi:hypothetical protein